MILDDFFKPKSTDNLTERVTFDANGNPIYPNLQNFQGAPAPAPAAATDDAAADTADDDAAEPPVAPVGGSAQLQNPAARAEYQRVRSTADKFSFSNPEFRKEYDRIARFRDTASNRIMSGNRSYSPEPGLAARQHQELVKMLYQIDADFVQDANILLKNYGSLKEQDMDNDNLQDGRPDDKVKFSIDSEPAYYAVMDRFGDHIDFRGDDMVAPLRLWSAIQQTAGDAGGAADIAGLEDDRMETDDELDEQGIAENYSKHQDLSGISTDKLKAYITKQGQQQVSGEGNQVRRVRAELERRMKGVAESLEQDYLSQIPNLTWKPLTRSVWNTIQDEGLDEEQDAPKHTDWVMSSLTISSEDSRALQEFDSDAIEDFNRFDIHLKSRYPGLTDLIDYDRGTVTIVKPIQMQGVAEGHGNYAGDRPVNLGGVSIKKIQIGDTVRYIDQTAQVVDMSRDRKHARITIPSSATTKTVLTSDLRQLGRGVLEGNDQQLSVQQLATISDEALDNAYGYGRSSPGNTFGWQANLKSAAYAKQMIDRGATDIEAISDAIHQGWNTTAKAFVQNPEQFDDTEKLRAAGKLEAKLQQRAKLMNIDYDQLPDDEQEKDRVVARALLQALKGRQDAEAPSNKQLDELSPATLARYKTKAGAAATAADSAGDRKTGDRRFSGIVKATKKQFDQDAKQSAQAVHESRLRLMASIIKTQ